MRTKEARRLNESEEARKIALRICELDPVFFFREFVWTYDPREAWPFIPFVPFPSQEEAIRWFWDLEQRGVDGILAKSRDTGFSWLTAGYAVHRWLFRRGAAIGFGSRKLEYVDQLGDPKSIFEKLRIIIRHLPPWMMNARASGFDPKEHDNYCKLLNPANGSSIVGEGGENIGRGGRTSIYFVDESAFLKQPKLADQALSANSKTKIHGSTPNGPTNPFAEKYLGGAYPTFQLHWSQDERQAAWVVVPNSWIPKIFTEGPYKGELCLPDEILSYGLGSVPKPSPPDGWRVIQPYYELLKLKYDPVTIAQEYDIDFSASLDGVVIPAAWLRACIGLELPPSGEGVAGFDVAGGGEAFNAYTARFGPVVKRFEAWRSDDPSDTADSAIKAASMCLADNVSILKYDAIGVGSSTGGVIKRMGERARNLAWSPVNVGTPPTERRWPDGRTSREMFHNLKAELYWVVRQRAYKTWEYVNNGVMYPADELLSLPKGEQTEKLIGQASSIRYFETEQGKIIIESKESLKLRNVASPDILESLILSFSPTTARNTFRRSGAAGNAAAAPKAATGSPLARKRAAAK